MSTTTKTLYETDFVEWTDTMAALLRAGRFAEVDLEHVAEEIESLGTAQRRAVRSQLQRLMTHLLKQRIQPERDGLSWKLSIRSARNEILDDISDAPSLKRHLEENIERAYRLAVDEALRETGLEEAPRGAIPRRCPWTFDELLNADMNELATADNET